jgi:hypothetical protein
MSHRTRWSVPAIVAGSLACSAAVAHAAEPSQQQDMQQQIQALQQQIDQLKTAQQTAAASATVDSVLKDADLRSDPKLQATATDFTAGYKGGKFVLQSADGNFSLNPNFQLQVRNVTNHRENGGEESTENGFELRRAKFGFAGNVYSKDLTYEFLWETNRNTGAVAMQDAWVRYRFAPSWLVRAGQFKDPLGKEQTGSSKRLLAAERSLLNELLIGGDNYVQGLTLIYGPKEGPFKAEFGITDGTQSANTNFLDDVGTPDTRADFGVAGRGEYQILGNDFKGYDDFTAMNQTEPLLVLGAGVDFTQNGDSDLITYTVDAQFETTKGLGLFGAIIGRSATVFNAAGDDADDIGFVLQAGQMLGVTFAKAEWEAFGRVSYTDLDDARVADPFESEVPELTIGVNGYFRGHSSKITIDATYLPNGSPQNVDGAGILQSDEDQFVLRAQYQLLI